jgi:uncharacterized repeat protein (TIGR03803 family)
MSRYFSSISMAALTSGAALFVLATAGSAHPVTPQTPATEQLLYEFGGRTDGQAPSSGLIADQSGNFYGTAEWGGDEICKLQRKGPKGCGVVYKITSGGGESILHAFANNATDGGRPNGYLASDASGNLYGTTFQGGANGYGTIYELAPNGAETVLYSFPSTLAYPYGVLRDAQGNLYGTTYGGSGCANQGCGTVFQLAPNGTLTVLYAFTGPDGANPSGTLAMDSSGNLYGATANGGSAGDGAVFELAAGGAESVLYSFQGNGDGIYPGSGVTIDAEGNLYGTTSQISPDCIGDACGVVFEVSPGGAETVLHAFQGNPDGTKPAGSLTLDASGNIYGTTLSGGPYNNGGTVYELAPGGAETILWDFGANEKYGYEPQTGVILDQSGNLYGATLGGGRGAKDGKQGKGTVFKLTL